MKKWSTKPEMSLHHCISPPWHFWFVGLFYVLLNAVGAYDYIMTLEPTSVRRITGIPRLRISRIIRFYQPYSGPLLLAVPWLRRYCSCVSPSGRNWSR